MMPSDARRSDDGGGNTRPVERFGWKSTDELGKLAGELSVAIPTSNDVSVLAEPVQVGGIEIPNSLAIHPMEGCDGDAEGRPDELTIRRYDRFAAGGAGLIWAEAIAVTPEGRANPRQLWLHEANVDAFAALVARIRRTAEDARGRRPMLVAQLTHSGRYARPGSERHPIIVQHDPHRDGHMGLDPGWPVATDDYLDELRDVYVSAARLAFEAGFDAVDIKACHGYLVGELLCSHRREGRYGGPFENRTRFLLDVIDRIHSALGGDRMVVTRLGVFDAVPYPYGWGVDRADCTRPDLTEPKRLVGLLAERGVPMINVTLASPYYNPHIGRPFDRNVAGGYEPPEHPLVGVCRAIDLAGSIQKEFPGVAIVGTGYSWLQTLFPNVAAAVKMNGLAALVGAGRLAFAYPDFAADILERGRLDANKVCIACSGCTQIMRDGGRTGCVVRDRDVYGPILKAGRVKSKEA